MYFDFLSLTERLITKSKTAKGSRSLINEEVMSAPKPSTYSAAAAATELPLKFITVVLEMYTRIHEKTAKFKTGL